MRNSARLDRGADSGFVLHAGQTNVTLNLNADVLSQIFTCNITSYNSPSIRALNSSVE